MERNLQTALSAVGVDVSTGNYTRGADGKKLGRERWFTQGEGKLVEAFAAVPSPQRERVFRLLNRILYHSPDIGQDIRVLIKAARKLAQLKGSCSSLLLPARHKSNEELMQNAEV